MPKVIFAAESARLADHGVNTGERLVNLVPEAASEAARSPLVLRCVAGLATFGGALAGGGAGVAVIAATELTGTTGTMYVLSGRDVSGTITYYLDSVTTGGTVTALGNFNGSGFVDRNGTIETNNGFVTIAVGGMYRLWNIGTPGLSAPTGGAFSNVGSLAYLDGYTIISENAGPQIMWTGLADPTSLDALDFATKEGRTDNMFRIIASQGRLYLMGRNSTEIWANTGLANAEAFARIPGAVYDVGIRSRALAVSAFDSLWIVSDDQKVMQWRGGEHQAVSNRAIEDAIAGEIPTSMYAYEARGQKFIGLRFLSRPAWEFNTNSGLWHERSAANDTGAATGLAATVQSNSLWHGFVETSTGAVSMRFADVRTEGGAAYNRLARSRTLEQDGRVFRIPELEARFGPSRGGASFTVTMRHSSDGGATWSTGRARTILATSPNGRAKWNGLGSARVFMAELAFASTDPAPLEAAAIVRVV